MLKYNDAKCNHEALNSMMLIADDGATINIPVLILCIKQISRTIMDVPPKHIVRPTLKTCFHYLLTHLVLVVVISIYFGLTQKTDLRNTCSGSGTECILTANNLYFVTNTDNDPLTISPYQSITLSCSGSADSS